nr:zinc finger, CCHC-type [Tanacetum cinerariifolium]
MGKTVNELHAMLKLHEQTLPKNNAPALNAIQAGKVQKGNKRKKSQSQKADRGQNHGKGKNKQAYAPKPKITPLPKRGYPAKDSICHECGHPVTLCLGVSLILIGLRKEYNGFVQNYNMHSMGKIVNELHAMLKLHEQTLPKNNAPALNAIRAGKVQK